MADTFDIERSALIAAPPEKIFPLIDDFRAWAGWSPWEKVPGDELMKTYSGADRGVGAVYAWRGKRTGQGRMEITVSTPPSLIETDLQFLKPFKTQNLAVFRLELEASGTRITWTMTGKSTLNSKVMGLFMNMDKMVGASFERGLATMKALAEG